mgnify:CR=1 FL=1
MNFIALIKSEKRFLSCLEFRNFLVEEGVPMQLLKFYGDFWNVNPVLFEANNKYLDTNGYPKIPAFTVNDRLSRLLNYQSTCNATLQASYPPLDIDTIPNLYILPECNNLGWKHILNEEAT